METWVWRGSGDSRLAFASGIAVDGAGNVYVADTGNARVQKFDARGQYLGSWGSKGNGAGQFDGLGAIAVDSAGTVHTTEFGNGRVQVFAQKP